MNRIPAVAIAGFRHAGRDSVLGALIRQKPKLDRWAVIGAGCNGAQTDIDVEEIAPGCPCCSAMLPFRVGLTRLLRRTAAEPPALLLIKGGPEGHVALMYGAPPPVLMYGAPPPVLMYGPSPSADVWLLPQC